MDTTQLIAVCAALVGLVGTVGGGLFWLGVLHGRVKSLASEQEEIKTKLEEVWKVQVDQATLLGRFEEKFRNIDEGLQTLYRKVDTLADKLSR